MVDDLQMENESENKNKGRLKKAGKIILRVYSVFCMVFTTLFIIGVIVLLASIGRLSAMAIGQIIDSYNEQVTETASSYISHAVPDGSLRLKAIQTIEGGGIGADFILDENIIPEETMEQIIGYNNMTNQEIIEDLGITPEDIPSEVAVIVSLVRETLFLDFEDTQGTPVINRVVTTNEISSFLKTGVMTSSARAEAEPESPPLIAVTQ